MISDEEYQKLDGLELGALIASRAIRAEELLDRVLERASEVNPLINALPLINEANARARARAVDARLDAVSPQARQALNARHPYLGVPLPLKDLSTPCVDLPSSMGSRFFANTVWPVDGELVTRYRNAGFIPFARSTSPELGACPSTEALAYGGPTRNPWNLAHSSGGSSGGAAACVAAGVVPVANASDGLGSIRIPAACCGLIGLKPSRGLIPAGPLAGEGWGGLATDHVVSVTVRDTAAVLDATAGMDLGAPYAAPSLPPPPRSYRRAALEASQGLAGLRIALLQTTFDGRAVDPEVSRVLAETAKLLVSLGHEIEPDCPPVKTMELVQPAAEIVACGTAMAVEAQAAKLGRQPGEHDLEPAIHGALALGRTITGAQYLDCVARLHAITRRVAAFFERYDVLLMPVLAEPPALLGRITMANPDFLDYRLGPRGILPYSPFTPLANVTGQPALSFPAGFSASGLPIGMQLVARFGADELLIALAAQLEAARGRAPRPQIKV